MLNIRSDQWLNLIKLAICISNFSIIFAVYPIYYSVYSWRLLSFLNVLWNLFENFSHFTELFLIIKEAFILYLIYILCLFKCTKRGIGHIKLFLKVTDIFHLFMIYGDRKHQYFLIIDPLFTLVTPSKKCLIMI